MAQIIAEYLGSIEPSKLRGIGQVLGVLLFVFVVEFAVWLQGNRRGRWLRNAAKTLLPVVLIYIAAEIASLFVKLYGIDNAAYWWAIARLIQHIKEPLEKMGLTIQRIGGKNG